MRMWSSYCALIAQNVILNYVDNIHHSKRLMRELDHCREKCREANAISKGKKYITMRYGQKNSQSTVNWVFLIECYKQWMQMQLAKEYINCVEMAEYFSARMINYEGVFQFVSL